MEKKISINNEKNTLCTKENDIKLKIFSRPKLFDTLLNSTFE